MLGPCFQKSRHGARSVWRRSGRTPRPAVIDVEPQTLDNGPAVNARHLLDRVIDQSPRLGVGQPIALRHVDDRARGPKALKEILARPKGPAPVAEATTTVCGINPRSRRAVRSQSGRAARPDSPAPCRSPRRQETCCRSRPLLPGIQLHNGAHAERGRLHAHAEAGDPITVAVAHRTAKGRGDFQHIRRHAVAVIVDGNVDL